MPKQVEIKQTVKKETQSQTSLTSVMICPHDLIPSPCNNKIYKPVDPKDPAIRELAQDIAENGILETLAISADGYILSGHRRREAAILAGLSEVPCRIEGIRHDDPEFLKRLTAYNVQRVKTRAEAVREVVVRTDPDEAYRALIRHREKAAAITTETIQVDQRGRRKTVSRVKDEMVDAIKCIIIENRKFWPLSDRQIHYRLLNHPPLRNTKNPKSRYRNNRASYQDTCDLLTRLRLDGEIPMAAISDPTRPTSNWYVHGNLQGFVRQELNGFLKNYRRDLQQSQPLHFEVVAEKMTVESIIEPVCGRYNIPYTIGRGYSSLPARFEIVQRFRRSGKERLLLLVLGDFDPEGVNIGESLLQSLRSDFYEYDTEAVRVGLNLEHVERFLLADNTGEAKKKSTRYKGFVERYGKKVYELEALTPEQLQHILSESIDSVIDTELFNTELETEKSDAAYLQAVRDRVCENCIDWLTEEDQPSW